MALYVKEEFCVQCGECWRVCSLEGCVQEPQTSDEVPQINPSLCNDCMLCMAACPVDAIVPENGWTQLQRKHLQKLSRKQGVRLPYEKASFDQFLTLSRTRRVYRGFKETVVPDCLIRKILDAARWTPSAANQQPWIFVVVKEPQLRQALADLYNRGLKELEGGRFRFSKYEFMYSVPVFILACLDGRFQGALAPVVADGIKQEWLYEDMGAVCQTLHLAATSLGLATGWITPPSVQLKKRIAELFMIPAHYEVFALIPLGYPDAAKHRRYSAVWFHGPDGPIRREVDQIIHYNGFDPSKERDINEYMASLGRFQELTAERRRLLER